MDIRKNRQVNLMSLLDRYGPQQAFAKRAGVSQSAVSRGASGSREIGETLARQIEAGLGLEVGWMDRDHSRSSIDDRIKAILGSYSEEEKRALLMLLQKGRQ